MNGPLTGKVALITGGSKGIGLAIARRMYSEGAEVMITSRSESNLRAAVEDSPWMEMNWFVSNAGNPEQARVCVEACVEKLGRLDILVNNAGTNPYHGELMKLDVARADKTVAVNQTGPLIWAQEAWNAWMAEHGGSIINISSIGGFTTEPAIGWYNVTKASLLHLTKQMAFEMAPGVRVNAVAPGLIRTDLARALWEEAEDQIAKTLPLGRLGEPNDIANMVAFLAGPAATWITGQTFVVDGGATIVPTSLAE
nr:SDR family oxidoreductase [Rhodococcus wratislaviensis]GLK34666.1 3-ketoacyl-ACP reductase [Rhodococcus wratislaviensis]